MLLEMAGAQIRIVEDGGNSGAAPRHRLPRRPTDRAYQTRTKYRQIYRHFRLLALSNLFRVDSRRVDTERLKLAL